MNSLYPNSVWVPLRPGVLSTDPANGHSTMVRYKIINENAYEFPRDGWNLRIASIWKRQRRKKGCDLHVYCGEVWWWERKRDRSYWDRYIDNSDMFHANIHTNTDQWVCDGADYRVVTESPFWLYGWPVGVQNLESYGSRWKYVEVFGSSNHGQPDQLVDFDLIDLYCKP